MREKSGIINLNLLTKTQQAASKEVVMHDEMQRLERANTYIKDEPAQIAFFVRNENRIAVLKTQLDALEVSVEEV